MWVVSALKMGSVLRTGSATWWVVGIAPGWMVLMAAGVWMWVVSATGTVLEATMGSTLAKAWASAVASSRPSSRLSSSSDGGGGCDGRLGLGSHLLVLNWPLLTRVMAGAMLIFAQCFEEVGFVRPEGTQSGVLFYSFKGKDRTE